MLHEFIEAHVRRAWAPGDVDCLLVLADWCVANDYPDPAEHLRGTYHDEEGFRAIIAAAGSAVAFIGARAASIGLRRVSEPLCGDIAVIGSERNIHRQFGAVFDGSNWRVRFVNGFPSVTAQPLAIWRVECQAR